MMGRFSAAFLVVFLVFGGSALAIAHVAAALASPQPGVQSSPDDGTLPKDVYTDSRGRLPLLTRDDLDEHGKRAYDAAVAGSPSGRPEGVAAILV
jgi:hypothetical protein